MEHTIGHSAEQFEPKNEVMKVTIILSVLTIVELALGFLMYKILVAFYNKKNL